MSPRKLLRLCLAIALRPSLWFAAFRQSFRLARQDWWKSAPFLPLPSNSYLEFRFVTQYGSTRATPQVTDVLDYLEWCRGWESTNRPMHGRRG